MPDRNLSKALRALHAFYIAHLIIKQRNITLTLTQSTHELTQCFAARSPQQFTAPGVTVSQVVLFIMPQWYLHGCCHPQHSHFGEKMLDFSSMPERQVQ